MADIHKGELQDNLGNTMYPHTEADVVFCTDGKTAQEKLTKYENALGSVTGKTDSLKVNDSNILATSKAVYGMVADIYVGEDGKLHKVQGGADSVLPFSSKKQLTFLGNARSYNIAEFVGLEKVKDYDDGDFLVTYGDACPFTNIYLTACSIKEEFSWTYNNETGTLTVKGGVLNYTYSYMGNPYNETMNLTPAVYMLM